MVQPEGRCGSGHGVDDLSLLIRRRTRGGDVDRFLKERAIERIGLVEDGERAEGAAVEHALHRELPPGDEGLHQD